MVRGVPVARGLRNLDEYEQYDAPGEHGDGEAGERPGEPDSDPAPHSGGSSLIDSHLLQTDTSDTSLREDRLPSVTKAIPHRFCVRAALGIISWPWTRRSSYRMCRRSSRRGTNRLTAYARSTEPSPVLSCGTGEKPRTCLKSCRRRSPRRLRRPP